MKFNIMAVTIAAALSWGVLAMFLTGVANILWPGYGQPFLDAMASLYPGYKATAGIGQVIIGTLYGMLDGAIVGAVFAWLHNCFVKTSPSSPLKNAGAATMV